MTYETSPIMRQMALAFARLEKENLFPATVGLAMSACESGWWSAVTGDWNYWGMTRAPERGLAKFCHTNEHVTAAQLATLTHNHCGVGSGVIAAIVSVAG